MPLEMVGIKGAGDLHSERVVLRATEDVNIGSYILFFSNELREGLIASDVVSPIWLVDKEISEGDYVVVYTRSGIEGSKKRSDGNRTYFFYRGLAKPQCSREGVVAVLLEARNWSVSR